MWNARRLAARLSPAVSSAVRRSLHSGPHARMHARSYGRFVAGVGAVGVFALGASGFVLSAEEPASAAEKLEDMKKRIVGNYERRIRAMSTPEKVFETFASVKKDGERLMTPDDFLRAIVPMDIEPELRGSAEDVDRGHQGRAAARDSVFRLVDADGDGFISFSEYLFFTTLLAIPKHHFEVAFHMFDLDGNGTIDQHEFAEVIRVMQSKTPSGAAARGGRSMQGNSGRGKKTEDIAPPVLFGKDGKKHLTFEKFAKFINQLHDEIAMMEFARFDVAHKGEITMRDFAMLAVSQARPSDLSDFISRAEELRGRNDRIKFKEYQSFLRFVRCIDDVEIAIRSFHDSTGKLTRSDLKRVARAVTKTDLSDTIIEAIFYVFDSDRSETLEPEEFVDVLRERNTFGQTRKRDIGVVSALKCCKECIQENILS